MTAQTGKNKGRLQWSRPLLLAGVAAAVVLWMWPPGADRGASDRSARQNPGSTQTSKTSTSPETGALVLAVTLRPESNAEWTLVVLDNSGKEHVRTHRGAQDVTLPFREWNKLQATCKGHVGIQAAWSGAFRDAQRIPLTLHKYGSIRATASLDARAVQNVSMHLLLQNAGRNRTLLAVDADRAAVFARGVRLGPDESGEFLFDALLPGHAYRVSVSGFRYLPVTKTVRVEPGVRTDVAFDLELGVRIRGRFLDEKGKPIPGAPVYVMRQVSVGRSKGLRSSIDQMHVTGSDGAFQTGLTADRDTVRVRLRTEHDESTYIIDRRVDRTRIDKDGTIAVGDLSPLDTAMAFQVTGLDESKRYRLTVNSTGQPVEHQFLDISHVVLDKAGRCRLVGIPYGEVQYLIERVDMQDGGIARSEGVASGTVVFSAGQAHFEVDATPVESERRFGKSPALPAGFLAQRKVKRAFVTSANRVEYPVAVRGGVIKLSPQMLVGRYELVVCTDDEWASTAFEVSSPDPNAALQPLTFQSSRSLTLRVVRGGVGVPDAEVRVAGFDKQRPAHGVEWGRSGKDGSVVLKGLPTKYAAVLVTVSHENVLRTHRIRFDDDEGTVEFEMD